jgi:hypothetical protein
MECTKCKMVKDLAKGKRWCKDCKNSYEKQRKLNMSVEQKNAMKQKNKENYYNKKMKLMNNEFKVDETQNKVCSTCGKNKNITDFYISKSKMSVRAACKECYSNKRKEYYIKNKDKICKQTSEYKQNKMNTNVEFKLEVRMRSRIYIAFTSKKSTKKERTWKYIGCTASFLKEWISYQLYDGMTYDNYGVLWHIDHVKPCASFNLSNENESYQCFNWTNLRPLIANKNISKGSKINIFDLVLQELKVECFKREKGIKMSRKAIELK